MVIEHGRCCRRRRRLARVSAFLVYSLYIERVDELYKRKEKKKAEKNGAQLEFVPLFSVFDCCYTAIVVFVLMPLCTRWAESEPFSRSVASCVCQRFIQRLSAAVGWDS
jgi:hypothetical protein